MNKLDFLIKYLLKENKDINIEKLPQDLNDKKRLYRSLCNIREPIPVSDEYIKIESEYLKEENISTTPDTVFNYVDFINSSSIFNKVNRYDIRGKNVMITLEKYYLSDLGLLQLKSSPIEKKVGGRLENIVYNELISIHS